MTRTDAILHAIGAMLADRRAMVEDVELRRVTVEARIGRDGVIQVVFFTPSYARETSVSGLSRRATRAPAAMMPGGNL